MTDLDKQTERIEAFKKIKPLATINGIEYYDSDEHQKFLDAIDPNDRVYLRQKDEFGKTIFNGANRVVINPTVFFAITYWLDVENEQAHFVTDPLAIFSKNNATEFKTSQVQGFTASYVDGVVAKDFKRRYFNRDEFVNNFSGNLYQDDPNMAIALFKTLSSLTELKSAVSFKLK